MNFNSDDYECLAGQLFLLTFTIVSLKSFVMPNTIIVSTGTTDSISMAMTHTGDRDTDGCQRNQYSPWARNKRTTPVLPLHLWSSGPTLTNYPRRPQCV